MNPDRFLRAAAWAAVLSVALAGCSAAPLDYRPVSETPAGPGLFTGEKGKFTFSSVAPAERRDLEEFRRQKEAGAASPDYREFQEWREWQEFRAWKERARPR